MKRICHLIDDTSAGGVTRFLDYMRSCPDLSELATQEILNVQAGFSKPPRPDADIIVSHVVLSWKNLPFFLALRAANSGTALVHMEHSYSPAFEQLNVSSRTRFRAMMGITLSLFDKVISICEAQRDWLTEAIQVPQEKVVFIPPCVNLRSYLAMSPATGEIRSIGAFGRFDTQKGFDLLIPAFRRAGLSGVTLNVFGDGPERAELEALADGDPAIRFHGFTNDPCAAMASVDAVAMPSRREPYGLVALEALAAGRDLLVSRVDGLIDHARNGAHSVDRLTVDDWCQAIRSLPERANAKGRQRARQLAALAGEKFVTRWTTLIEELTA